MQFSEQHWAFNSSFPLPTTNREITKKKKRNGPSCSLDEIYFLYMLVVICCIIGTLCNKSSKGKNTLFHIMNA